MQRAAASIAGGWPRMLPRRPAGSARMGWMWGAPVQGYVHYMAQQRQVEEQEVIDEIAARIPLRRIVSDDECARAALFLVSDMASGVTGATLDINGGEYMPG